jgi:orotidine-5'-phosphate decarboxylase
LRSRIVDATADLVIAFKPQIAYFAAHRAEGQLERLMEHMRRVAPHVPIILDAKRGDIGSTAEQYAKEAFERYGADAVTLSPFMGFDSVQPYLKYEGKGAFLLCRTSNPGGDDLQNQRLASVEGSPCCTSMWRGWPRARGTSTASWAWWWVPPTRQRSSACGRVAPTCRC